MAEKLYRVKWSHSSMIVHIDEHARTLDGTPCTDPVGKLFRLAGIRAKIQERVPGGWEEVPRQLLLEEFTS